MSVSIFRSFPVGVLLNGMDAGGGGGGEAPGGVAPIEHSTPPEVPGDEPRAAAGASDDDGDEIEALLADDDADDVPQGPVDPQRFAKIRSAHNKLKRRFGKAAPTLKALREAGVRNVSDLLTKAQQFDAIATHAQRDAKLRALLFGDGGEPTAAEPAESAPPAFDPKKLPFPVSDDDPLSGFLANLAQQVHDLTQENQRLKTTVTTDQTARRQQVEQAQRTQWVSAVEQAKKELPAPFQKLFHDAMVTAYQHRHRHRLPVEKVIEHYLADARKAGAVTATQARVATAAVKERAATANANKWPAHVAGGGAPAPANRAPSRLRDVHKRVRTLAG